MTKDINHQKFFTHLLTLTSDTTDIFSEKFLLKNRKIYPGYPRIPRIYFRRNKDTVPECQPSTTVVLDTRSGCRKRTEMREVTPSKGILLNPRGECTIKALGDTGESDRLQVQTRWNWRDHAGLTPFHFLHYVNSPRLSVALGDSWPRWSSPLILIPCIITFIHFAFTLVQNPATNNRKSYYQSNEIILKNSK